MAKAFVHGYNSDNIDLFAKKAVLLKFVKKIFNKRETEKHAV